MRAARSTYAAEFFRWFSEEAVRIGGELRMAPSGANRILTFRKPVGVALLLTPWNFPAAMATRKVGPALAAGCTVILKPAHDTPLTALLLAQVLADAGAPAGVVNVLTTDHPRELVAAALARCAGAQAVVHRIDARWVANCSSRPPTGSCDCSMELGGNAPFVVLDDADLDAAVSGAMLAKMRNGGQACTAANRFLVQESVASEFAHAAGRCDGGAARRRRHRRADPTRPDGQREGGGGHRRRRSTESVAAGAVALLGGARLDRPGYFYPATVLTDVPRTRPWRSTRSSARWRRSSRSATRTTRWRSRTRPRWA